MRTVKKGKAKVKEKKKEKDKQHPVHVEDWDQNRHGLYCSPSSQASSPNIGPMSRDGVQLRSRLGV